MNSLQFFFSSIPIPFLGRISTLVRGLFSQTIALGLGMSHFPDTQQCQIGTLNRHKPQSPIRSAAEMRSTLPRNQTQSKSTQHWDCVMPRQSDPRCTLLSGNCAKQADIIRVHKAPLVQNLNPSMNTIESQALPLLWLKSGSGNKLWPSMPMVHLAFAC